MKPEDRRVPELLEIETQILSFVEHELLSPGSHLGRDDDLLSGGVIDSVGVLRLAAFVADEFQFSMPPRDFVIENFQTVAALAAYVGRALSSQTPVDGKR